MWLHLIFHVCYVEESLKTSWVTQLQSDRGVREPSKVARWMIHKCTAIQPPKPSPIFLVVLLCTVTSDVAWWGRMLTVHFVVFYARGWFSVWYGAFIWFAVVWLHSIPLRLWLDCYRNMLIPGLNRAYYIWSALYMKIWSHCCLPIFSTLSLSKALLIKN